MAVGNLPSRENPLLKTVIVPLKYASHSGDFNDVNTGS
jgi:hypothetical protein